MRYLPNQETQKLRDAAARLHITPTYLHAIICQKVPTPSTQLQKEIISIFNECRQSDQQELDKLNLYQRAAEPFIEDEFHSGRLAELPNDTIMFVRGQSRITLGDIRRLRDLATKPPRFDDSTIRRDLV